MKWTKRGIILSEELSNEYGFENPQVPYAFCLEDKIRIFFGARLHGDSSASVFYIDVDKDNPSKILQIENKPILSKGRIGCFDEDGILPVCIKEIDNKIYMYYGGFSKAVTHSHFCMMGLAISVDGGNSFERYSEGPIIGISKNDPFLIGSADILFDFGCYNMIYTSGSQWKIINNKLELCYSLKYASSIDGIDWNLTNIFTIANENDKYALAKPSLFKINDEHFMIYSKREITNYREKGSAAYKLITAKSKDLVSWTNTNDIENLLPSNSGWDSEMVCYPNVFNVKNRYFMLYNGNGFGKSGFGYAELEY